VFAVADAAGLDRFVAAGHSMGGKLAQYLPLVDTTRLEGLVLAASAPPGKLAVPATVARWLDLAGDAQALADATIRPTCAEPCRMRCSAAQGRMRPRSPGPISDGR